MCLECDVICHLIPRDDNKMTTCFTRRGLFKSDEQRSHKTKYPAAAYSASWADAGWVVVYCIFASVLVIRHNSSLTFFLYILFFLWIVIPHVVQFTSTRPGDEVTAAPQNSPNYVIFGASAAGGVLLLVNIAVVIRKCLCKTRTSSAKQPRNIGRVNDCLDGDLELSTMTGKIWELAWSGSL